MMMAMPNSMPAMSQEQKQQIQLLQQQYSAYVQQQLQQWQRQQGEQQSQQRGMIPNAARHVVSVPSSGASSPLPPGAGFPLFPPPAAGNRKQQQQKQKQKEKVAKAATVHARGKRWARKSQYLAAQLHMPPFFVGKKLRSGKWTEAEETYANRLVKDFNLGALPDCKPGVTLRAYLARKLHCSPMRISKKYAGNNVGKAIYLGKGTPSLPMHTVRPGMPEASRAPNAPAAEQAPLFTLEALFYRSIDCGSGSVSGVCSSASSTAPTPSAGASLGPTPPPPPLPFGLPADGTTCIPPMYQQAAASQKGTGMPFYPGFVQVPHAPDQNNMPQHVPSPFVAPPMLQPVQQQLLPPHAVHSSGSIEARPMSTTDRSKHDHAKQNKRSAATTMQTAAPSACHQKVLHQSFLKALNAQCANNAASKGESNFPKCEQADETNNDSVPAPKTRPAQVREGHSAHATTRIEKSDSSADIPEFLSGFEKIASASESSSQLPQCPDKAAAIPGAPPTPTFTSKSFDDMHRFLGAGIPSMPSFGFGERNSAISSMALSGGVQEHTNALDGPATDALLEQGGTNGTNTDKADMNKEGQLETIREADASYEYALLAQRSVIAVMQHSAYSLKNSGNSGSSNSSTSESSAGARAKKCRIAPLASRSTVSSTSDVGGRRANVISGSERSSSELGESEFGSSRGTSSGSDDDDLEENGSNKFDSPSVLTTRKMKISGLRSNESTPKAVELSASPDDGEVLPVGPSTMSERW